MTPAPPRSEKTPVGVTARLWGYLRSCGTALKAKDRA